MTIAKEKYTAESGHWYDLNGKPAYTTVGKNGKERNTTLRDARTKNLVPSVTTIMSVAAKPGLENWKINQALMAALTLPQGEDESLDAFMFRAKADAKESSIQAAKRGTAIHADIEQGFTSNLDTVAYRAVRAVLTELFPETDDWEAEASFCAVGGYGGKIDLYSTQANTVVDFKTKDGLKGKDAKKLVFDEHGMQLSAYANGLEMANPARVSIFIDRDDPSIALSHTWDAESHDKHLTMFLSLLTYWQASKGYKPVINAIRAN